MRRIDAGATVVVVIDTQPGFYAGRADVDDAPLASFVDTVAWVVGVASALYVPTVVTVERPEKNGPTADIVAVALPADSAAFEKRSFDVTADEAIRATVNGYDRRTAVLVGMETDVCVAQSAMGLLDLGYRVAAVADAVFAPGAAHGHGLERLRASGVELVSAKALFYEWLPSVDAVRAFKRDHPSLACPSGTQL